MVCSTVSRQSQKKIYRLTESNHQIKTVNPEQHAPKAGPGNEGEGVGTNLHFRITLHPCMLLNSVVCSRSSPNCKQFFSSSLHRSIFDKTCTEIELISGFVPQQFSFIHFFSGYSNANSILLNFQFHSSSRFFSPSRNWKQRDVQRVYMGCWGEWK